MKRMFRKGNKVFPQEGIFWMTLSVNAFTRYCLQRVSFSSCASLSVSLRLSASVKKCLPLVVRSHSNFLLSQLDRKRPNAELQKGAAARNITDIIEFQGFTYANLDELMRRRLSKSEVANLRPEKQTLLQPRQLHLWRTTSVKTVFGDKYSQALWRVEYGVQSGSETETSHRLVAALAWLQTTSECRPPNLFNAQK